MRFLALVAALLLDHFYPNLWRERVRAGLLRAIQLVQGALEPTNGIPAWVIWSAVVGAAGLSVFALHALLQVLNAFAAWLFAIAIMYLLIDWNAALQALQHAQLALRRGDVAAAAAAGESDLTPNAGTQDAAQAAALVARRCVTNAHQYCFALMFWFMLLGPGAAALYWSSAELARRWHSHASLGPVARRAHAGIDWLPVRLSALVFAAAGDFEDALYCWRTQAHAATMPSALVVASAAGAVGMRINVGDVELGVGDAADADYLQSLAALLWRALLFWLGGWLLLRLAAWGGAW